MVTKFPSGLRFAASPGCAIGIALTLSAIAETGAQTDTTRRAASDRRIPIRKDAGTGEVTRRTSEGDVRLVPSASRIDSLEAAASAYRARIDALEAANAGLATRLDATDRLVAALRESLNMVRDELAAMRSELSATTARVTLLADSVYQLNRRFILFRNRSMFGNSGFYVGLGTGTTYTRGALVDMGYVEGLQVTVPIGWHKRGSLIGVRTEWAWQNVDGRLVSGRFSNVDPNIFSAVGMVTLHVPFNMAKTHTFYAGGGGGVYMFRDFQSSSALGLAFAGSQDAPTSETKFGLNAAAGLQFHVLGATYLFVQTSLANVSADRAVAPATSKNLSWVPLVAGVTIR